MTTQTHSNDYFTASIHPFVFFTALRLIHSHTPRDEVLSELLAFAHTCSHEEFKHKRLTEHLRIANLVVGSVPDSHLVKDDYPNVLRVTFLSLMQLPMFEKAVHFLIRHEQANGAYLENHELEAELFEHFGVRYSVKNSVFGILKTLSSLGHVQRIDKGHTRVLSSLRNDVRLDPSQAPLTPQGRATELAAAL